MILTVNDAQHTLVAEGDIILNQYTLDMSDETRTLAINDHPTGRIHSIGEHDYKDNRQHLGSPHGH